MALLQWDRYFTSAGFSPFTSVRWGNRNICITDTEGKTVFEAKDTIFPRSWSQRASTIVASKYFRIVDGVRESSVAQIINRVAHTIYQWGVQDGYFDAENGLIFYDELIHILLHQYASFNSPVWFNVGVQEIPQTSACFLLAVDDTMESILDWYKEEGMIFKGGSGAGINLSNIRAKGSPLSGGGTASGVLSFMKVADANAGAIKSGGTTRRAACMRILNIDHPEIRDFIRCKVNEEEKAAVLRAAGYSGGIEGEALTSVAFQNSNNSVAVTDQFMRDLNSPYKYYESVEANTLFKGIADAAWSCGDPGLQFIDTINKWHTCPNSGPITTSNPCSEFVFLDNAACNLASINLMKFRREDGDFDVAVFKHVVDILITAQDILVDRSSYPTEKIAHIAKTFRPLGLGYSNLGGLLMEKGIAYDSDAGRNVAAAITALMTGEAYIQSGRIAVIKGHFGGYEVNSDPMWGVLKAHYDAKPIFFWSDALTHALAISAAESLRAAMNVGKGGGYRNAQVTLLAPCGTISFMMDCETTGIEPYLGVSTTKQLVGGGNIHVTNEAVTDNSQCALGENALPWQAHVKMVAAVQPFLSGAVSKTINMPADSTVDDIKDAYVMAWELGLKSIAVYRDGCKGEQPVTVKKLKDVHETRTDPYVEHDAIGRSMFSGTLAYVEHDVEVPVDDTELRKLTPILSNTAVAEANPSRAIKKGLDALNAHRPLAIPQRKSLPDERNSLTHKFSVGGTEGYLTVGFYPNGSPGEVFVTMAKEGSTLSGLMDAFASMVSMALQYGVPLEVLIAKLRHTRYEPHGFTTNKEIHTASSLTDYIAQWLEQKFVASLPETKPAELQHQEYAVGGGQVYIDGKVVGPACPQCFGMTQRNGSCWVCGSCGTTTGCS